VERILDTEFIRPCRYIEWVFNFVPVEKKGIGKIWECIDFHNLNKATPKDEYTMLIAYMLINNDSRMSSDLPRGTGKSIGGDLDIDGEGSEQRQFKPV
jgi:hypothetical protein